MTSTQLWRQPTARPIPQLPEINSSRDFPLDRYWQVAKDPDYPFDELDFSNLVLRQVVLDEISKRPPIWCSRSRSTIREHYPEVAVTTFKRTGVLLSLSSINRIYKGSKDALRNRLRLAVVKKRLSPAEVEDYMWNWELYPFIRHYREFTQNWEAELQMEIAAMDGQEPIPKKMKKIEEDDDIIWEEPNESSLSTNEQLQQDILKWAEPTSDEDGSTSSGIIEEEEEAPQESDFDRELVQIMYQASRVIREQPDRIRIMRKALFDTILAFDMKEYDTVKDLFKDLYEKN